MHPVAILAGGLATRLRPITETIPKALIEVHGRPFIAWQLDWLRDQGVRRVVVCAGYLGDQIRDVVGDGAAWDLDVAWLFDGPVLLGTAGALKRAVPLLGGPFFVLYGDSYLPIAWKPVQDTFDASGKLALMTVFRNEGQFDRSNVEFAAGEIVVYDKKTLTPRMHHIDYGLGLFAPAAFDTVPDGQPSDLAALYGALLAQGQLAAYEVHERFYEIGSFEGIKATEAFLAERR
jgi:N-acetyl-alpha-D-muramate 1-phosphate uridylyltransferase